MSKYVAAALLSLEYTYTMLVKLALFFFFLSVNNAMVLKGAMCDIVSSLVVVAQQFSKN